MFKISPKTIVLGGLAIAAAAGALKNRDKVAGLIGARSSAPEPPRPEAAPTPPAPSNYDIAGPAANMATKVAAPEAVVRDDDGGIDERAEEQAAAAEAAAIGGTAPEYPGPSLDEGADDATRPLAEAGEGESEGEELAEFDLKDEAEPRSGEPSDAERQVDEAIEAQGNPAAGESGEALESGPVPQSPGTNGSAATTQSTFGFAGGKVGAEPEEGAAPGLPDAKAVEAVEEDAVEDEGPEIHPDQTSLLEDAAEEKPKETPAEEKSSAVWEPPKSPGPSDEKDDEDDGGGSEWQTWSGRAIRP